MIFVHKFSILTSRSPIYWNSVIYYLLLTPFATNYFSKLNSMLTLDYIKNIHFKWSDKIHLLRSPIIVTFFLTNATVVRTATVTVLGGDYRQILRAAMLLKTLEKTTVTALLKN